MACEARNVAADAENKKRMRKALGTAEWKCEENGIRCKWVYDDVVLAAKEQCVDADAGNNHKSLAMAARSKVQSLK